MQKLSGKELLRNAMEQTGLSAFGGGEIFQQDFDRFISALDMDLVPIARREWCKKYILNLLMNRLWFEKDLSDHPEILDEQLLPPVAIVSLPRAGTTKLQRILGETDQFKISCTGTPGFRASPTAAGKPEGARPSISSPG